MKQEDLSGRKVAQKSFHLTSDKGLQSLLFMSIFNICYTLVPPGKILKIHMAGPITRHVDIFAFECDPETILFSNSSVGTNAGPG